MWFVSVFNKSDRLATLSYNDNTILAQLKATLPVAGVAGAVILSCQNEIGFNELQAILEQVAKVRYVIFISLQVQY